MAIAATWTISTARSPTTWQPRIARRRAVGDQLAEAGRPAVDDRARGRVEAHHRDDHIVRFAGLRLGQADLGIFRVGEAADRGSPGSPSVIGLPPRTALVAATKPSCDACGTSISRPVTSPAAKTCGAEVRRWASTCTNPRALVSTPAAARFRPGGVGHPAHRHDHERSLSAVSCAVLRENHPHAARRLLERLDATEALVHHHARLAEGGRDRRGHVFVLGRQDARAAWKSCTCVPKALKIEATCAPVAPPPTTSIDGGTAVRPQASLWVAVNSKPGTASRRLVPPRAEDELVGVKPQPALGLDGVRVDEARGAGPLVDRHAQAAAELLAQAECARTSSTTSRTRASSRG